MQNKCKLFFSTLQLIKDSDCTCLLGFLLNLLPELYKAKLLVSNNGKTGHLQEAHNPLYGFAFGGAKYVLSDLESDCPDGQNDSALVDKGLFAGLTS